MDEDEEEVPPVMIHVRFHPNGSVLEIGERPKGKNPQEWYDFLREKVDADSYQAFSGGRGVFRMSREQCDGLKAEVEAAWEAALAAGQAIAAEPIASKPESWRVDGREA